MKEAVDLLLYGSASVVDQTRKDAEELAEALGVLPIALQQARSYMQQAKCTIRAYLGRLSNTRHKLLKKAIKPQVDMRAIATYAGFETSFNRLLVHVQKFLRLLSHFHWVGFPFELVTLAAEHRFSEYERERIDHGDEFYTGQKILEEVFLSDGEWDVIYLDEIIL